METVGRRIAEWVARQSYDDLPTKTVHEVKRRVIDSIGTALGAYLAPACKIARAKAKSLHDTRAATVWGSTHSTCPELAAFANGAMVRYLNFNDAYLSKESAHPSDNIPAAAAVAQVTGGGGTDAILAMVIAYEVQCRLCDADSLSDRGWDHVIYGSMSSALAAGKLWGLDEEGLECALAMAGVCNIATRQTRAGRSAMWAACTFSNAARNGVFAADLARRGMTGPQAILQGPDGLMNQLGIPDVEALELAESGDYRIDKTHIKYWPAEYHAQSAIDAVLQLRPHVDVNKVESIHISSCEPAVDKAGAEPEKWCPATREAADHSMSFCTAVAMLDGDVNRESFADSRLRDPWLLDLLAKTRITANPELNQAYPRGVPNHVTVTMNNGKKVDKRVDFPRGHCLNHMTDEEVVAKFRKLARGVVTDGTADTILDRAWHLDELSDLRELFEFKVVRY